MKHPKALRASALSATLAALVPAAVSAAPGSQPVQQPEPEEPVIVVDGQPFFTWQEYTSSHVFRQNGLRCALPELVPGAVLELARTDCSSSNTSILPQYEPTNGLVQIPVVVHVIQPATGSSGFISESKVDSQIQILNEDFRAILGSNGENGTDVMVQFYLAEIDPDGLPTTGITYSRNNTWWNDGGSYWNTLAWDPVRYLNIYTNLAGGALGYVPYLPQTGTPGALSDRVVCLWSAFGLNAPIGPPYNKGRTVTHEVGHYLGLFHTFSGGCAGGSCYSGGDLICDTNNESGPVFGCPGSSSSCSSPNPYHNYMDYSDDLCMEEFTPEQSNRMRCTVENYRAAIDQPPPTCEEPAAAAFRNAGTNPASLSVSNDPVLGGSFDMVLNVASTGHSNGLVFGYAGANTTTLGNGATVLLDLTHPGGELLSLPLLGDVGSGSVTWPGTLPSSAALCGFSMSIQGVHLTTVRPFALSNAYDLLFGI